MVSCEGVYRGRRECGSYTRSTDVMCIVPDDSINDISPSDTTRTNMLDTDGGLDDASVRVLSPAPIIPE